MKPFEDNSFGSEHTTKSRIHDADILDRVQQLTDVELAMLVSLMASQHCIIGSEAGSLGSLGEEIGLVKKKECPRSL